MSTGGHGISRYIGGCRCGVCRAAMAKYRRDQQAELRKVRERVEAGGGRYVSSQGIHGTYSTYVNYQCRCTPCRRANATYQAEYQHRRRIKGERSTAVHGGPSLP